MSSLKYSPPWFDRDTGDWYGPETATTYAKHCAKFRDWAYRAAKPERPEAALVRRYFEACWEEVPGQEVLVYRLVYVMRMSLAEAAEAEGLHKSSVKCYVKRLRTRAEEWKGEKA